MATWGQISCHQVRKQKIVALAYSEKNYFTFKKTKQNKKPTPAGEYSIDQSEMLKETGSELFLRFASAFQRLFLPLCSQASARSWRVCILSLASPSDLAGEKTLAHNFRIMVYQDEISLFPAPKLQRLAWRASNKISIPTHAG